MLGSSGASIQGVAQRIVEKSTWLVTRFDTRRAGCLPVIYAGLVLIGGELYLSMNE